MRFGHSWFWLTQATWCFPCRRIMWIILGFKHFLKKDIILKMKLPGLSLGETSLGFCLETWEVDTTQPSLQTLGVSVACVPGVMICSLFPWEQTYSTDFFFFFDLLILSFSIFRLDDRILHNWLTVGDPACIPVWVGLLQVSSEYHSGISGRFCQEMCSVPSYSASLQPCMHTFCAACYSGWMERSSLCPTCRCPVERICKNHILNNLVEAYLIQHPGQLHWLFPFRDLGLWALLWAVYIISLVLFPLPVNFVMPFLSR